MKSQAKRPQNLEEWSEIATKVLVPSAKSRIRLEVEAHYAEAVAAYVAEGLSESDANAAALVELGDARVAARRLRKTHLTLSDLQYIERAQKLRFSISALFLNYLFFGGCLFMCYDRYRSPAIPLCAASLLLLVFPTILFVKTRGPRTDRRLVSLSAYLNTWTFFVPVEILLFSSKDSMDWGGAVVLLLVIWASPLSPWRFWCKLQELPPPNAASS
jgi:hypothetical protein